MEEGHLLSQMGHREMKGHHLFHFVFEHLVQD